jgi:hypothetical protein
MNTKTIKLISAILMLAAVSLACGASSTPTPVPTIPPAPTEANEPVSQWAVTATASSEFGVSGWIATQATGAPDVAECGDNAGAWASSSISTVEWLQLGYAKPVFATEVVVYISYNPNYVTSIELIDTNGTAHTVYTNQPTTMACPAELTVSFPKTSYLVSGVKVTIDLTTLNDWSEIDAVQLTGPVK